MKMKGIKIVLNVSRAKVDWLIVGQRREATLEDGEGEIIAELNQM